MKKVSTTDLQTEATTTRIDLQELKIDGLRKAMVVKLDEVDENLKYLHHEDIDINSEISKLNRRLDKQSYVLCLLSGIAIGLLIYIYFIITSA